MSAAKWLQFSHQGDKGNEGSAAFLLVVFVGFVSSLFKEDASLVLATQVRISGFGPWISIISKNSANRTSTRCVHLPGWSSSMSWFLFH